MYLGENRNIKKRIKNAKDNIKKYYKVKSNISKYLNIQLYFLHCNKKQFYISGPSNLLLDKIKSTDAFNIRVLVPKSKDWSAKMRSL